MDGSISKMCICVSFLTFESCPRMPQLQRVSSLQRCTLQILIPMQTSNVAESQRIWTNHDLRLWWFGANFMVGIHCSAIKCGLSQTGRCCWEPLLYIFVVFYCLLVSLTIYQSFHSFWVCRCNCPMISLALCSQSRISLASRAPTMSPYLRKQTV